MNINYESYKIFYTVAINESISAAANELLISQPAVSFQIKSLEEQIGIALFVRTKKGVILTEEGKVLFDYVKKGIESFSNGENTLTNLRNLDRGNIRIGASTTVSRHVLMPYLEIFHEKYPNIDIEIVNTLTETLLKELRNGNLDILILNLPIAFDYKDLNVLPVMKVQDIFVGNKRYYDLTRGKVKLEELQNFPLLFQKNPSNTRKFLDKFLNTNHVLLRPKTEIVSYNLIMDFIKSGFGIGYATKEFIKEDLNKTLFEIKVIPTIPKRDIGIVTLNNRIPNYSVKKLIDLIKKKPS